MEEQWRTCVYDGVIYENYEVSTVNGKIRSLNFRRTGKMQELKPTKRKKDDYLSVILFKNGKQKRIYVHRLVAFTFPDLIPNDNPTEKTQINHIDENPRNNSVDNLEWVTPRENTIYGTRTERSSKAQGKRVRCIETGQEWESLAQASKFLNTTKENLCLHLRGKSKSCKGLHFEYVEE